MTTREEFLAKLGMTEEDIMRGTRRGSAADEPDMKPSTPLYGRRGTPMGAAEDSPPPHATYKSNTSSTSSSSWDGEGSPSKPKAGRRADPPLPAEVQMKIEALPTVPSAQQLKDVGNQCFQAKCFTAAIRYYSMAIELSPDDAILYSNRSAAYLQGPLVSGAVLAVKDAQKCVALKPTWFKGWSRQGDALFKQGKVEKAYESYQRSLELEPTNTNTIHSIDQCKARLHEKKTKLPDQLESAFREKHCNHALPARHADGQRNCSVSAEELASMGRDYREVEMERYRRAKGKGQTPQQSSQGTSSSHSSATSPSSSTGPTSDISSSQPGDSTYSTEAARAYRESLMATFREKKKRQEGQHSRPRHAAYEAGEHTHDMGGKDRPADAHTARDW